jgi:hypothetical protein
MHSADHSVLKPWAEVPCVVKVLTVPSVLCMEVFISSPLPPSGACKPAQRICNANVAVERMGRGLKVAYRETPREVEGYTKRADP